LLKALIPAFEVAPAGIVVDFSGDPAIAAVRLARLKAEDVAAAMPGEFVIGADTIVHDGTRPYGKPEDAAHAAAMLTRLRGHPHRVLTGIALMVPSGECRTALSDSAVTLAALTDAEIAAYVASGRPMDKAGAYAIQDEDVPTVANLDGCYCGVMGLPLWKLRVLLLDAGLATAAPHGVLSRCAACPERPTTMA
jgi:septum formation protein